MSLRSHPIIIFLDRNGFLLYQDLLSSIWQFPFSEDQVMHLEVTNKEQLVNVIWNFIEKNKLMPSSLIVVLSDSVVFQKDLSSQGEIEIQQFLENVPFEEYVAKVIGKTKVVATNKELLEGIVAPFKKLGCTLEAVVPSFVYENKIDFSQGLSLDAAKTVLKNQDLLKIANMLVGQKEPEVKKEQVETTEPQDTSSEKPKNTRQLLLIIVFIILLVVLGVVYFTVGKSNDISVPSNTTTNALGSGSIPTSTIGVAPTATNPVASPSLVSLKDIKATIVVNTQTQAVGNILKKRLEELGLESVTVSVSDTTNPARSSVLLASSIDSNSRRVIADEVRKILSDASVQESQSLEDLSVSITVGSGL